MAELEVYVVIHDCGPRKEEKHEVLDVLVEPAKRWVYQAVYTRYTPHTMVFGAQPLPDMR